MQDSSRPVRKRRRPAHSCVECRRRKVRCDRNKPCGQCVAHKVPLCAYDENHRIVSDKTASVTPGSGQQEDAALLPGDVSPHTSGPSGPIRGTLSKTRVFGHGHWMNTMPLASELSLAGYQDLITQPASNGPRDSISQLMTECKRLGRDIKKQRPGRRSFPIQIHQSLPRRKVIDELIQLYFTTFESCYRILHFPSFQKEYESYIDGPENANSSFALVLVLVMSVAGILHSDADVCREIAAKTSTWIHISQTWLSAPLEKDRLTLKGIQIHCLLLLAREVNRVGADLIWISAGSLLRMAMQMGLHQDPSSLGNMDMRQMEVRRRLWYTIVEMNAQAALDSGMSPMLTDQDYNTQPPSDLSDADLESEEEREYWERLSAVSTRASFQCLLAHSITLRLDAARVINSLQEEPPYNHVLALGNKLADVCRQAAMITDHSASMNVPESTNQFAWSFCTHLLRRFLLCLHFTYAVEAKKTQIYAHSQKVCLEIGLEFVSLLDDHLYSRVLINGGGMFRDIITRGALMIYLELNSELETGISMFARQRSRARQMSLLNDVHRILQYSKDRMYHGETNVKGYFFLSIATAQSEALLDGLPTDSAISNAAHESLVTCREILKTMELDNSSNAIYPSLESGGCSGLVSPLMASDSGFDFLENEDFGFNGLDLDVFQAWADEALRRPGAFGQI